MTGRLASLDPSPALHLMAPDAPDASAPQPMHMPYTLPFSELLRILDEADHRRGEAYVVLSDLNRDLLPLYLPQ